MRQLRAPAVPVALAVRFLVPRFLVPRFLVPRFLVVPMLVVPLLGGPLLGGTALAQTRDDGEQPGPGLSVGQTVLLFVVVPLVISAVLALLTFLPSIARGPRYRPGRGWTADPVWFGAPDNPDQALDRVPVDEATRPGRGGTSARW